MLKKDIIPEFKEERSPCLAEPFICGHREWMSGGERLRFELGLFNFR